MLLSPQYQLPIILALLVVLVLTLVVILWRKGYKKQISQTLFYLVVQAEKQFGGGTGDLKFSAVTTWIYQSLPPYIRLLFTTKQIDLMIEDAVVVMKDYLNRNANALSAISPPGLVNSRE